MHKSIEVLIGRLATDAELLRRFADHPYEVIRGQLLELTAVETEALAATPPDAIWTLAVALDARLRKAPPATRGPGAGGDPPTTDHRSIRPCNEETKP